MYSFSYLKPACCSMSSSNCCFLTCIQVSQEAGQVVLYAHLFQNFPQFIVIQTVKGFGIVNKAEINVFLELSCFFDDPVDVGNLISVSSAFSKTSLKLLCLLNFFDREQKDLNIIKSQFFQPPKFFNRSLPWWPPCSVLTQISLNLVPLVLQEWILYNQSQIIWDGVLAGNDQLVT